MNTLTNYIPYHIHSDLSLLDSATKSKAYLQKAKELGMVAIGEANHGNIFNWVKRKEETEKLGMKYIHAVEIYLTEDTEFKEQRTRDNYHTILIARNFEGVKEINRLVSRSYNRDYHFYYDPRVTIDELIQTSDNVLVTTACIASPLGKGKDKAIFNKYLKFLIENKHRCWLEIQHHNQPEQIAYNQLLYSLHKTHNISLIAGTDTHALHKDSLKAREILLRAKKIMYETWDLTFKSLDELIDCYERQKCFSSEIYLQAINNTNILGDMIEEFKLDKDFKYPKLYEDSKQVFIKRIAEGMEEKGINSFDEEKKETYYKRINYEFDTYIKCGAIDYMLLMDTVIKWCTDNGIDVGYGRGSVSGSLIAYLLGITQMDSIRHKLIFERFMNPDRISLPDIDTDLPPSDRNRVIDFVSTIPGIYFGEIVTFNTIADKGAIREVGRSLEIPLDVINVIAKNIDDEKQHEIHRKEYPELFKYVDLLKGVNVSVGSHPSGFIVSPIPIDENMGTFSTSNSRYPVSQINMKELDGLNYVKLDLLGLDNIEIINKTCILAEIPRLTPDNIDTEDNAVWSDIASSGLGIFQMESPYASSMLSTALSNYPKMNFNNPDMTRIDLMSAVNGAIRPVGESFRNNLCNGIPADNKHEALNKFLAPTLNYLLYQEQIIEFLHLFCGFSLSEADNVRRLIGKKIGTENIIPEIKERFINTMHDVYKVPNSELETIVEPFLQIILDASDYGFSINHSSAYTQTGYACGYLRYHFPLEFLTVMLNMNENDREKTSEIIGYANKHNIKVNSIKFRYSQSHYSFDKETNSIFKGMYSIKYMNETVATQLSNLYQNVYDTFTDLLIDIAENTSIDSRQMKILILLNFFSEFGKNKKLFKIFKQFDDGKGIKYDKKYTEKTKKARKEKLYEYELNELNESIDIKTQLMFERDNMGYCVSTIGKMKWDIGIVLEINTKYTPFIRVYNVITGIEGKYKIPTGYFNTEDNFLAQYDIICMLASEYRYKRAYVNGVYKKTNEQEEWLINYFKPNVKTLTNKLTELFDY